MTGDIRLRMAFNRTSWQPEGEEHGEEFRFLLGCLSAVSISSLFDVKIDE